MSALRAILSRANILLLGGVVLISPWLFGAWEMWWFWPLATLLFASTGLLGLRFLLPDPAGTDARPSNRRPLRAWLVLSLVPFLLYAAVRTAQADVFMDAERAFLLHLTGVLVGLHIVFGTRATERRVLFFLILANFYLLWLYAMINHGLTGSTRVLWAPGYAQYYRSQRVTGSYFCPDHFAGIMELAFAGGLALILARDSSARLRVWGGVLILAGLSGVVYSQSRGGGLTILAVAAGAFAWGFAPWPPAIRIHLRAAVAAVAAILLVLFCFTDNAYTRRFRHETGLRRRSPSLLADARTTLRQQLIDSSRGRMFAGALRAWRSAPLFGIGPGMHQNVWPHVAASGDGDRARGRWPTKTNETFHSYEVHNDWLQLLEEFGLAGLALILVPIGVVTGVLRSALRRTARRAEEDDGGRAAGGHFDMILTALLAGMAMAFHSLVDFNLQMPATTWILAALIGLGVRESLRRDAPHTTTGAR